MIKDGRLHCQVCESGNVDTQELEKRGSDGALAQSEQVVICRDCGATHRA